MTQLEKKLKQYFNYDHFRPGQREAVETAVQGVNSLVMLPTGTGKSLCYQLSGYINQNLTLIVSPLISLMMDQVFQLKQQGEKQVAALTSFQDRREKNYILSHLHDYKFIYLSPEMLFQAHVLDKLSGEKIGLFVVDEAHCISQWGMDFRPEYLMLGDVREKLNYPTTMALTATANQAVRKDIQASLFPEAADGVKEIFSTVDRPNIKYSVRQVAPGRKEEALLQLTEALQGPGIIYFSSKKKADEVAEYLQKKTEFHAQSYHADLDAEDRYKIQMQFDKNRIDIVCATSAFGMGINKSDIRYIIHYHLPASPEMYLQETGRAGRDGRDSLAVLLYEKGDESIHHYFHEEEYIDEAAVYRLYQKQNQPLKEAPPSHWMVYFLKQSGHSMGEICAKVEERQLNKRRQLEMMMSYIAAEECRRAFLLAYFDEKIDQKDPLCCDNCEENLIEKLVSLRKTVKQKRVEESESWEKILSVLFNK